MAPAVPVRTSSNKSPPTDLVQAEEFFRRLVKENPAQAEAWHQLGLIALRKGRLEEAVELLGKAVALDPGQPLFQHQLAAAYQSQGRHEQAVNHFDHVVRLKPDCAEAHNNLGIALARKGNRAQAEAAFSQALRHKPDFPEALNNLGNILIEQGKPQESLGHFRQALALNPNYAEACHNLGFGLMRLGQAEEAAASMREALRIQPAYAEAHLNLASIYRGQGRHEEALAAYRAAVKHKPENAEARIQLAFTLAQLNRHEEAVASFHQCLLFRPDSPDLYNNLGIALARADRLDEAVAAFRQAVRLKPDFAESLNNLGNTLLRQNQGAAAIECFRKALELRRDYPQPYCNLGSALLQQGQFEEAVANFREALRLQPDYADAHFNLGNAFRDQGKLEEALACYDQVLKLQPANASARLNRGVVLAIEGHFDEAVATYEQVLTEKPEFAEAHSSLGVTRLHQARPEDAIACFERAIQLKPEEPDFHLNRALAMLSQGDFERGFVEYEWRWKQKKVLPRPFPQPVWDGAPHPDGTILLHAEQGMGDTLQFIRYAGLVKERVGTVLVECPAPLRGVLSSCPGIDTLIDTGTPLPAFDVQAALMSLPRILGTTTATIPGRVPYLFADAALRQRWRQQLGKDRELKVGLVWRGNPRYAGDRYRSLNLEQFRPLAEVAGARLYSLQKSKGAEQVQELAGQFEVVDLGSRTSPDFQDTAAVIANLDLVVAVDTAVAHLAGALGVPVWILLPFNSDWRWLRGREESPWYPTARLFRQAKWGDWDEVLSRMARELAVLQRQPRSRSVTIEVSLVELAERLVQLELSDEAPSGDATALQRRQKASLAELWRQALPGSEALTLAYTRLKAAEVTLAGIAETMVAMDKGDGVNGQAGELVRSMLKARQERAAALNALAELAAA
jgi:tetratricopeptide (TPR) repeat protein